MAGLFPRPTFKDKSTYVESSTKVYDDMAFRYLSWILFPLLGCYAVYSLLYLEHKGWYSWVLSMLYGFLLTFGEQAWPASWGRCPADVPPPHWATLGTQQ